MPEPTPHPMAIEAAEAIHELWAEVDSMTAADRVAFMTKKGTAAMIDRTCRVTEREARAALQLEIAGKELHRDPEWFQSRNDCLRMLARLASVQEKT